jgi:xylulokinase
MLHLNFNRHNKSHIYRAALEGIAYSFVYGVETLINMGIEVKTMKVGNDNLFQSNIFSSTIANVLNCTIEMIETTGALGAARASGIATGHFNNLREANQELNVVGTTVPEANNELHVAGYQKWKHELEKLIK